MCDLLREYGEPYFLKIDIEGYDLLVLQDLLAARIRPARISAEAHSIEVVATLIAMGYTHLQLINGREVGRTIARRTITRVDGTKVPYLFRKHAAGPFDDDLPGPWLNPEAAMLQWIGRRAFFGRGWMDVHARV